MTGDRNLYLGQPNDDFRLLLPVTSDLCEGLYGYVDTKGRMVIEPRFALAREFSERLAAVRYWDQERECSHWGYIDPFGQTIIPPRFEEANPFQGGLAPVKPVRQDNWEIINPVGRTVVRLPREIQGGDTFFEGLASVTIKDRYSYIDPQGNLAFPLKDFESSGFRQGYAEAFVGVVKTYMDRRGRVIWLPE